MDTDGTGVPPGGVARVRIAARDVRRAARFYEALFGWRVVGESPGELWFRAPGGLCGAFWASGEPSTAGPELYVRVESVDDALRAATALGGARLVRPGPGPAGVRVAQVMDTEGNRVCLWEG
ncbi:MAG: VOC family protein [Myxococcota bacterium]